MAGRVARQATGGQAVDVKPLEPSLHDQQQQRVQSGTSNGTPKACRATIPVLPLNPPAAE